MKCFHVHLAVADLDESIGFYSTLFDQVPTKLRPDYAQWELEDRRRARSNRYEPSFESNRRTPAVRMVNDQLIDQI